MVGEVNDSARGPSPSRIGARGGLAALTTPPGRPPRSRARPDRAGSVGGSVASVPQPTERLLDRLLGRGSGRVTDRDWERSVTLEPRPAPYVPDLVSDGGGLPFAPAALDTPPGRLRRDDPAVTALAAQLARQRSRRDGSAQPSLDGWRMLARSDREVLFGLGRPPELLTVAMRRDRRHDTWTSVAVTRARPLRAQRDGVRASSWRLDPTRELVPEDTVLRVLVTEQTRAGGKRAGDRLLAPDLHEGDDELVLTMFVTPREGFQSLVGPVETPARVVLPRPIGHRPVIDGALHEPD